MPPLNPNSLPKLNFIIDHLSISTDNEITYSRIDKAWRCFINIESAQVMFENQEGYVSEYGNIEKNFQTLKEAYTFIADLYKKYNLPVPSNKNKVQNNHVCKQNIMFYLSKEKIKELKLGKIKEKYVWKIGFDTSMGLQEEDLNKKKYQVDILKKADYAFGEQLNGLKFETRKDAAAALSFFLHSYNFI